MSPTRSKNAPLIDAKRLDAERLTRLGRATMVAPSPCGHWLVVAVSRLCQDDARFVSDLWRVSLDDRHADPEQLTLGDVSDSRPRFRKDGALFFLSDRPVNVGAGKDSKSRSQVWYIPSGGGEPRPVTDEPLGVRDFRLARDTGRLFVLTDVFLGIPHERQQDHEADLAKRGPTGLHFTSLPIRHWDHWLLPQAPHVIAYSEHGDERVDLTPDADREHRATDWDVEWDVSPDGDRTVIACSRLGRLQYPDAALRLIDATSGEYTDLGVVADTTHASPRFSPDGRTIACIRTLREPGHADRDTLWLFDVATGDTEGRPLAADWDRAPRLGAWTHDGSDLLAWADDRGHVPLFRIDVTSGTVARITSESAAGSHTGVVAAADGDHAVGLRHRFLHPPEPFRVALEPDAEPEFLACLSGFHPDDGAEIARWESFTTPGEDDVEITSFAVLPNREGPFPGLLWVHGGPVSQWADGWHWRWNPLVAASAGYAVVLPNPRGSTGRGQEFIQGIWNNQWGAGCYRDVMAVVDAMDRHPDIDDTRLAAMGGSFGGYMANWIGVHSDRFRCLISHAGIYSMSSFAGATDYGSHLHHMLGVSPHRDLDQFERYSPSRQIVNWRTPTLVIHGERDYRVPIGEALQLFDALRHQGVDAEFLVFPDENHWIQRPQNIRLWYRTVLDFLAKHLQRG